MNRDRKAYIRKGLKKHAPWGREMVLCGSLILLIWATGEFVTRWDSMDGLLKVIFNWVKQGKMTFREALGDIMDEPEARKDLLTLGVLGFGVVLGVFGIVTHRLHTGLVTLLAGIAAALYDPYGAFWKRMLSYGMLLKLSGVFLMIAGSAIKMISAFSVKRRLGAAYDKKHVSDVRCRIPRDAHGNERTLIPERAASRASAELKYTEPKKELNRR